MKIKNVIKNLFTPTREKWYLISEAESELRCRECYEDFEELYCDGAHNLCINCCACENKNFGDNEVIEITWKRGKPTEKRYAGHRSVSVLKKEVERYYGVNL
jgi:hypothetical protein